MATWYQSFPDSGGPITKTSWDIAPIDHVLGDQFLMHVSRLNDDSLPPPLPGHNQSSGERVVASWDRKYVDDAGLSGH